MLGAAVGIIVGCVDGLIERLGEGVGTTVGDVEGIIEMVGTSVGTTVGWNVGAIVTGDPAPHPLHSE